MLYVDTIFSVIFLLSVNTHKFCIWACFDNVIAINKVFVLQFKKQPVDCEPKLKRKRVDTDKVLLAG
jgi:hypothetical protein